MALPDQTDVVRVASVVDGDTVHVTKNGVDITVRALGIDTPETRDPRKPVQCYGPEATALAKELLERQTVNLQGDPTQAAKDRYGRTLAYIILPDGRNFSIVMAQAGAARAYVYGRTPVMQASAILDAQLEARQARRGLWGQC